MSSLQPSSLTWTALLGRWLDFARASVALPEDADGVAWKASVGPIITLQAITFALAELPELPESEHALGLDRSAIQIDTAASDLETAWAPGPPPESIQEVICDAQRSLAAAESIIHPPSKPVESE